MTTALRRPEPDEYAPFFAGYVDAVPAGDLRLLLRAQVPELHAALAPLTAQQAAYRYAEGKWSIREVVGHLSDTERIFSYRALRLARGDATPLPGFEENDYVAAGGADARTMGELLSELAAVRGSTVAFVESLPDAAWTRRGVVSGKGISVRALAYITVGHVAHHLRILRERYGVR